MPELPEVETVLRTLETKIKHRVITGVDVRWNNIIAYPSVKDFKNQLVGQEFLGFHRLGKYLIFELTTYNLIVHLRMEGKFYIQGVSATYDQKHTHVHMFLDNQMDLQYHDTRKFGKMYLYEKVEDISVYPCFKSVGYDAFDERLTGSVLYQNYHHKKLYAKQMLLNQGVMAGPGNIYCDEILFSTGLHPKIRSNRIPKYKYDEIVKETRRILNGAIKYGGTTIRSYTSSLGVDGRFQLHLKVHRREGEACYTCGTTIQRIVVDGRSTYFCPTCQNRR